mmetsp:Transcript_24814/g.42770  ORF Transcript_24814/g.42770 Transcript_24814/m.42770 type:complete len:215 (+) Transcript_24814:1208-1852(+)
MYEPNLRISSNMSRMPPENPRQLAKMNRGRPSRDMSAIAWDVLYAESGNHTWPACWTTASVDMGFAGSAGVTCSTERVSTAMKPTGMPPRRPRPVTTVLAQPARVSIMEPLSKKPDCQWPLESVTPASMWRESYGVLVGRKEIGRLMGSTASMTGSAAPLRSGTNESQLRTWMTPSRSSLTVRWETPLANMILVPPICRLDVYTSRPRTLLRAE